MEDLLELQKKLKGIYFSYPQRFTEDNYCCNIVHLIGLIAGSGTEIKTPVGKHLK